MWIVGKPESTTLTGNVLELLSCNSETAMLAIVRAISRPTMRGMAKNSDKRTPFQRFEAFAKKIVNVPKKEIDAKAKETKKRPKRV